MSRNSRFLSAFVSRALSLLLCAAVAVPAIADIVDTNSIVTLMPAAGWTTRISAKKSTIKGKAVAPSLLPFLTNGYAMGILRFDGSNLHHFGDVFALSTKNGSAWSFKGSQATISYTVKSSALSISIATQLPASFAVCVFTSAFACLVIDVSGGPGTNSYPVTFEVVDPTNNVYKTDRIAMRLVHAGTFTMGSPDTELGHKDDEKDHQVTLSKSLYVCVYEITQAQYSNVMGTAPVGDLNWLQGRRKPVTMVSWNEVRGGSWPPAKGNPGGMDTNSFLHILRTRTADAAIRQFELPTEAQWEYLCRAGTTTALNSGKDLENLYYPDTNTAEVARYADNGGWSDGLAIAGSYLGNRWGLFDLHGNAAEWCLDWYGEKATGKRDPVGPVVPTAYGPVRVCRGGSFLDEPRECRSAARGMDDHSHASANIGFRFVTPAAH